MVKRGRRHRSCEGPAATAGRAEGRVMGATCGRLWVAALLSLSASRAAAGGEVLWTHDAGG